MSVFGFIENFFFISLALVFILVLFLVYHFKSRITVAEKKSESMYGLLTAVVKEIKTLRGMFGLGNADMVSLPNTKKEVTNMEIKSKTEPEVIIPISASNSSNNTFESFVKAKIPEKEIITFEALASENRIVVSDMEDSDSDSDISSDDEDNNDDESVESTTHHSEEGNAEDTIDASVVSSEFATVIDNIHSSLEDITRQVQETILDDVVEMSLENVIDIIEQEKKEELQAPFYQNTSEVYQENHPITERGTSEGIVTVDISAFENEQNELNQPISEPEPTEPTAPITIAVNESSANSNPVNIVEPEQETVDSNANKNKPSIEQLRKMNINQLKGIASQLGITEDVSKMKKPELISLIQQK